ncbi:hypothetical protein Pcinc_044302 [Petrolisthes cinctipes]|uniref:Uncharacterized protein n=1 Tax=Petrolisthes cinctipes TaxID=88211 RepID=A0AAE1EFE5_PETCI|nr:hypothetical protein Pcinc_044302 [Petrolisthes cinctipes]
MPRRTHHLYLPTYLRHHLHLHHDALHHLHPLTYTTTNIIYSKTLPLTHSPTYTTNTLNSLPTTITIPTLPHSPTYTPTITTNNTYTLPLFTHHLHYLHTHPPTHHHYHYLHTHPPTHPPLSLPTPPLPSLPTHQQHHLHP